MLPGVACFGQQRSLLETLTATVESIARGQIRVHGPETGHDADVDIRVGSVDRIVQAVPFDIGVQGSGWNCYAGPGVPLIQAGADDNPFGAIFAACLGGAYAFRVITDYRGERRHPAVPVHFSLWDGQTRNSAGELPVGAWPQQINLPPFYLCGAGAVGQAFAATMGACRQRTGHAVILDRDPFDDTNANRYVLSYPGQGIADKTAVSAAALAGTAFTVEPRPMHWEDYVREGSHRTSHPQLSADEKLHKYRLLISCVDKNRARHGLQNYWPQLILGGSTLDLLSQVMRYDVAQGGECLKCNNPISAEMTVEEKIARAAAAEGAIEPPDCGRVTEQFLNEHGQQESYDFAVGFVSVGAGVLLAAAVIQESLGTKEFFSPANNYFGFNFRNNFCGKNFYRRKSGCDCGSKGAFLFHRLWG
jgi:hypothetical protein